MSCQGQPCTSLSNSMFNELYQYIAIGHGRSIYTVNTGKHYKRGVSLCVCVELVVKYLTALHFIKSWFFELSFQYFKFYNCSLTHLYWGRFGNFY